MLRRVFLRLLLAAKGDAALAFTKAYNAWIRIWNDQPPGTIHVAEREMWKDTKRAWSRLKDEVDSFYDRI